MTRVTSQPRHLNATDAFVVRHQAGLWRWLRAMGCDAPHAEEHCQDALLAALHREVHLLPTADASRWLRRAAKNLFLMRLRREKQRPRFVALESLDAPWEAIHGDVDGCSAAIAALDQCLMALTARDRDLIERRYRRNEPRAAMAVALGVSEAGIKQAMRRVRDRLRRCVQSRVAMDANETNGASS